MYSVHGPFIKQAGARTVAVSGLDRRLDNDTMYVKFAAFGYNIESCEVNGLENEENLGWGTICFATEEDADKTIDAALASNLNVSEMAGELEPRRATIARTRTSSTRRMLTLGAEARRVGEELEKSTIRRAITPTRTELPSTSRHNVNVIVNVKNFSDETTEEDLQDLFKSYGTINSCKIMNATQGEFRRFAFISFQDSDAANEAVLELNGFEITAGRRLRVQRSQTREERERELKSKLENLKKKHVETCKAVSLFVKHLEPSTTVDHLKNIFKNYGTLKNCRVIKNELGVSRQFGFVEFEDPVAANRALLQVNGKLIAEGRHIYVEHAAVQPNVNEQQEQRAPFAARRNAADIGVNRQQQLPNINAAHRKKSDIGIPVYVRNLNDVFDEVRLRAVFSCFGTILYAKIMRENGISKGYGFVNFETVDQARKAIRTMHNRVCDENRLFVDFARPSKYGQQNIQINGISYPHFSRQWNSPSTSSRDYIDTLYDSDDD